MTLWGWAAEHAAHGYKPTVWARFGIEHPPGSEISKQHPGTSDNLVTWLFAQGYTRGGSTRRGRGDSQ
eukprot:9185801-Pyramimonas_sp.AAC.1